jgi:hypothetical protein
MSETSNRTEQCTILHYNPPTPSPREAIPGGWHHIPSFGYDRLCGFIPVDPADCSNCRDPTVTACLGCATHSTIGLFDAHGPRDFNEFSVAIGRDFGSRTDASDERDQR